MFDFYRRQIEDFSRTFSELEIFIEKVAFCDDLTNEEYCELVRIATDKMKIKIN